MPVSKKVFLSTVPSAFSYILSKIIVRKSIFLVVIASSIVYNKDK